MKDSFLRVTLQGAVATVFPARRARRGGKGAVCCGASSQVD
ncbi:MAG: hypothetical protein ACLTTP_10385 [Alistipes ihumii]